MANSGPQMTPVIEGIFVRDLISYISYFPENTKFISRRKPCTYTQACDTNPRTELYENVQRTKDHER